MPVLSLSKQVIFGQALSLSRSFGKVNGTLWTDTIYLFHAILALDDEAGAPFF